MNGMSILMIRSVPVAKFLNHLNLLKEKFPGAKISILTNERGASRLENKGLNLITYPDTMYKISVSKFDQFGVEKNRMISLLFQSMIPLE